MLKFYNNDSRLFFDTLKKFPLLNETMLAYIAGFIDGDGSITAQIKSRRTGFKHTLQVFVTFFQRQKRAVWFFPSIKTHLNNMGHIVGRSQSDKVEFVITSSEDVKLVLILLYPFLHLKKKQAKYALDILFGLNEALQDPKKFLDLCKKADRFGLLNDSKGRTITRNVVLRSLKDNNII